MNETVKTIVVGAIGVVIGAGAVMVITGKEVGDAEHMSHDSHDMHAEMDHMMQSLEGKTGDAFDQAFLKEMIVHHEGAIEMAEAALMSAKHQEIKDLAQAILSAQASEIQMMKDWMQAWYAQ